MFDFRRITLFCLEKALLKHKMTIFLKNLGRTMAPLPPWLRLCSKPHIFVVIDIRYMRDSLRCPFENAMGIFHTHIQFK